MKTCRSCARRQPNPQTIVALALTRYQFATPEIRLLMRQALGHAVSGRTIKRLVRQTGRKLKRGRPPTTPHITRAETRDLVELTAALSSSNGASALSLFQEVQAQFGLTPRQYIEWVRKNIRRGQRLMRRCLLCNGMFCSMEATDRHCEACRGDRRRRVKEERRSSYAE